MYNAVPLPSWPGKQGMCIITRAIRDDEDYEVFAEQIADATGQGYTIQNTAINGAVNDHKFAWAILTARVVEQ